MRHAVSNWVPVLAAACTIGSTEAQQQQQQSARTTDPADTAAMFAFRDVQPADQLARSHPSTYWPDAGCMDLWLNGTEPCTNDRSLPIGRRHWAGVVCQAGHIVALGCNGHADTRHGWTASTLVSWAKIHSGVLSHNCAISALPDSLGTGFQMMRVMDLSHNQIAILPRAIGDLRSLEYVDVSWNQLQEIPRSLCELSNLAYLNLQGNMLLHLPDCIGQLVALEELYLDFNKLTVLPQSFGNLGMLREAHMIHNLLTQLPSTFGQLSRLTHLHLFHNRLESLPNFTRLVNLMVLEAPDNRLRQLPADFGCLTKLVNLTLSYNLISTLPSFASLAALEELYLSGNPVSELPHGLGRLSRLRILECMQMKLTETPTELGNCISMEQMYFDRNQLSNLPFELRNLRHMTLLRLNYNLLAEVPSVIAYMHSLQYLLIRGNNIADLPGAMIAQLPNLKFIDVARNSLRRLPPEINSAGQTLEILRADHNLLSELPPGLSLPHLTEARLNANQISQLPPDTSARLPALRTLVVSNNVLVQLPNTTLSTVENLQVQNNSLQFLPSWVGSPGNSLRYLDATQNQITAVPSGDGFRSMTHIFLRGNPINNTVNATVHAFNGWGPKSFSLPFHDAAADPPTFGVSVSNINPFVVFTLNNYDQCHKIQSTVPSVESVQYCAPRVELLSAINLVSPTANVDCHVRSLCKFRILFSDAHGYPILFGGLAEPITVRPVDGPEQALLLDKGNGDYIGTIPAAWVTRVGRHSFRLFFGNTEIFAPNDMEMLRRCEKLGGNDLGAAELLGGYPFCLLGITYGPRMCPPQSHTVPDTVSGSTCICRPGYRLSESADLEHPECNRVCDGHNMRTDGADCVCLRGYSASFDAADQLVCAICPDWALCPGGKNATRTFCPPGMQSSDEEDICRDCPPGHAGGGLHQCVRCDSSSQVTNLDRSACDCQQNFYYSNSSLACIRCSDDFPSESFVREAPFTKQSHFPVQDIGSMLLAAARWFQLMYLHACLQPTALAFRCITPAAHKDAALSTIVVPYVGRATRTT